MADQRMVYVDSLKHEQKNILFMGRNAGKMKTMLNDIVTALIANCPTVDAVEVVHGEWIMVIDENDCECIECPLCGEQFYDGDNDTFDKPYNYCPNCGAKMDGDPDA